MKREEIPWPDQVYKTLKAAGVRQVGYVPDAGHKRLIELCLADKEIEAVVLSTEEEGIGLGAGAWLGGARSALLMQSSGVGNCVNALGMVRECRFPLLMLVTMRGQFGEFNPWQVPMGQATPGVLSAMGVVVHEANTAEEIAPTVDAAARLAFGSYQAVAVLIAQGVIGIKSFQEQAAR
ncbi:MAG TPA: thiamine pyrophosphate-binding protein [Burkholderiales bacterium]|nr:thiamine pyrophosphate-binding protein [Burkholderiales bacterium]